MQRSIKIVVVFMSTFSLQAFTQPENDYILWGTRPIVWDDFKSPPMNKKDVAATASIINLDYKFVRRDSVILIIQNVFNKRESWTITDSIWVLNHERGHFNISEIFARKIRKRYAETIFKASSLDKDIRVNFNKLNTERSNEQRIYDVETEHSKNKVKQIAWDKKIQEELKQLEGYSGTIVPLKVDWKR